MGGAEAVHPDRPGSVEGSRLRLEQFSSRRHEPKIKKQSGNSERGAKGLFLAVYGSGSTAAHIDVEPEGPSNISFRAGL
jgi:hypothetical protein